MSMDLMLQLKDIEWHTGLKKKKSLQYATYTTLILGAKDTYKLKVKGWKKIVRENRKYRKMCVPMLISVKIEFKTKAIKKDKEGHYLMIKEENITFVNIYAPV